MQPSKSEVKMLAKAERMMDDNKAMYVILDGNRVMVEEETMDHFQLRQGQHINNNIFIGILEHQLQNIQFKIKMRDLNKKADED